METLEVQMGWTQSKEAVARRCWATFFRCIALMLALVSVASPQDIPAVAHSPILHPWLDARVPAEALETRISPPTGYRRTEVPEGSFAQWLRRLPLKKDCPPVLLFNGEKKTNQAAHVAVVDLDVGPKNLQQCADAVIRLRAEWQFAEGKHDEIRFSLTSGAQAEFARWAEGYRPVVGRRNAVTWIKSADADASYASFRRYLDQVFQFAGTASLSRELLKVPDPGDVRSGDVFIRGGYPGHAAIVLDVAENVAGQRVFLLAQSYMPAQEVHILKNPNDGNLSPWYSADYGEHLLTPEWTFGRGELRRFPSQR